MWDPYNEVHLARKTYFALVTALGVGCVDESAPPEVPTCMDFDVKPTLLPDVPLARQTPHLDIYSSGFVCAGTAAELDRHGRFVADILSVELRSNIPIFLLHDAASYCTGPEGLVAAGCAKSDGVVFATHTNVYHELNHSVACQLRRGAAPALSEGLAVMFDPLESKPTWAVEDLSLLDFLLVGYDQVGLAYASAHFVRWVLERWGGKLFAELYRARRSELGDTLELLYGISIDALEDAYEHEAPWKYAPFRQCDDLPHVDRDPDGVWRYTAVMDCDSPSTGGPYIRPTFLEQSSGWELMYQSFTFTVDDETELDYLINSQDKVRLERCPGEHPNSPDQNAFAGATMLPKDGGIWGAPRVYPGTWRADILRPHGPASTTEVSFWADP